MWALSLIQGLTLAVGLGFRVNVESPKDNTVIWTIKVYADRDFLELIRFRAGSKVYPHPDIAWNDSGALYGLLSISKWA